MSTSRPSYFVLGATGGIGSALCRMLASAGAELAVAARSAGPLQELAGELGARGYPLDATDREQVESSVEAFASERGRLDGIVNCVGSVLLKPAHRTSQEEWQEVLAKNLTSAFVVVSAGARAMIKTGGSIVLLSSAAARHGLANHEAIAAAKSGVIGLTRAAAASYAKRDIRVNAVAPGLVRTEMTASITSSPAMLKASEEMHPLGRLGEPDDVARAITWLLDPANTWISGQVIGVDGGLATVRPR